MTTSKRKQAAEEWRRTFDAVPDLIALIDPEHRITRVNQAMAERLGLSPEDAVGLTCYEAVHGLHEPPPFCPHQRLFATGEPEQEEVEEPNLGGFFDVTTTPLRDADGTLVGSVHVARDITERKRAEDALRESEEHYRFIADNVGDVLWVMDAATQRFTYVSPSVVKLRGYTPEEVMARPVSESLTPDSLQRVQELMAKRLLGFKADPQLLRSTTDPQRPVSFVNEADQPCKDGSIVHTEVITTWSRRPGGQLQIIGVSRDISERKRAEEALAALNDELEARVGARTAELEAANRELEAFVYSVSHDLRAPLRAIDGFSEMIVEDAAERLDAGDLEHLQRVRGAAQRMGLLIDHMLALSRAARKDLLCERVDLSAAVVSVLNDLRASAPERRVESLVQPGLVVVCDATLLRMILENLLGNAWKYTAKHESARIEVGVVDADGERAFYVKDDGAGFDGAHAEHLFGAFQRMHTAEQFEGDGIGLATVQRLVARHGGRVWAEAEVEKGATFYFTLQAPGHSN